MNRSVRVGSRTAFSRQRQEGPPESCSLQSRALTAPQIGSFPGAGTSIGHPVCAGTLLERFVDQLRPARVRAVVCHDAALEGLHQWLDRFLELHEARQFEWERNPISLIQVRCIVFVDFAGTGIIYGPEFGQALLKRARSMDAVKQFSHTLHMLGQKNVRFPPRKGGSTTALRFVPTI